MPIVPLANDVYRVRATAQDIIRRALRLIGAIAPGEPLPNSELTDALEAFNDLCDSWNTEKLMIPVLARREFTLTASQNPHEIGPGAALDAPRPTRLEQGQAFLSGGQLGDTETTLTVIPQDEYGRISDKTLVSLPSQLYYEPSMPLAQLWLYPVPDAAYTLILYLEEMLAQIQPDGTETEISLAPGYKEALVYNLAVALAPEYGRSVGAEIAIRAVGAKAAIKRLNQRPLTIRHDPALSAGMPEGGVDTTRFQTWS